MIAESQGLHVDGSVVGREQVIILEEIVWTGGRGETSRYPSFDAKYRVGAVPTLPLHASLVLFPLSSQIRG